MCLQPCRSREHPSEPLHPFWAQGRNVPPLSSVQPPPSPRLSSPEWPGRPSSSCTRCCLCAELCCCHLHVPQPFPHLPISIRMPGGPIFSLCIFSLVFPFLHLPPPYARPCRSCCRSVVAEAAATRAQLANLNLLPGLHRNSSPSASASCQRHSQPAWPFTSRRLCNS